MNRVEVRAVSLEPDDAFRRTVFTNADGDVEVPNCVGLPLSLTLVRPGKASLVEQLLAAPDKLTLTMLEGVEGRGSVTGRGGRDRLENAEVTVFTLAGARHVRTDAYGDFVVKDLAPGRLRIRASHDDHATNEAVVEVVGDRDHPADLGAIDLAEAGEVEGQVVDEGDQPVAGARVARDLVPTYLPFGPLPRGVVLTDRDGRFTLGGLPDGNASLEAYFVDLGRGRVDDVPVRAGRTTGRVKITLSGDPPGAEPKGAGSVALTLGERGAGKSRDVIVMFVPPNSEAETVGIEPGDEIVSVDGAAVHSIEGARRRLTGPLGEDVVVEMRREGQPDFSVRLRRERVRR